MNNLSYNKALLHSYNSHLYPVFQTARLRTAVHFFLLFPASLFHFIAISLMLLIVDALNGASAQRCCASKRVIKAPLILGRIDHY